jgi:K+-transporting ATPase ATPase C chain
MKEIVCSIRMFVLLTVVTGLIYPLAVTLFGNILFPQQAGGGILYRNGQIIGAKLIGQKFIGEKYFWGRPSSGDYNPMPSGATNMGPTSEPLRKGFVERAAAIAKTSSGEIPQELLFSSGSGLDPEISPEAALFQVDRIAKARGIVERQRLVRLIEKAKHGPDLGFLGEPRVNVLELNLALDEEIGK